MFDKLDCPGCGYHLEPSANTGIIVCPRCNCTAELNIDCTGACISCKVLQASPCATVSPAAADQSSGTFGLQPGTAVKFTLGAVESGGYAGKTDKHYPGFLATARKLPRGTQLEAIVVCALKGRLLLALPDETGIRDADNF